MLFRHIVTVLLGHTETTVSGQGNCCCCQHQLESIDLTASEQERFMGQVDIAEWLIRVRCFELEFDRRNPKVANSEELYYITQVQELVSTNDKQQKQWNKFLAWLQPRAPNFQVVVDGANVGYFVPPGSRPKPSGSLADLLQIDLIVRRYKQRGKRVLVMLHSRHVNQRSLSVQSLKVLRSWQKEGLLYACERGNNDDWYWLWAVRFWCSYRSFIRTHDDECSRQISSSLLIKAIVFFFVLFAGCIHWSWSNGGYK